MSYSGENVLLQNFNKISSLKKHKWQNYELLELAIKDHLNNAVTLQQHSVVHRSSENIQKFDQELMDLFILLAVWADDEAELFEKRVGLFLKDAKTKKG